MFQTLKPLSDQAQSSGERFSLENNPDLVNQMRQALSPERFGEWQQTQDPAYRDAVKLAQKYNLNAEDTKMLAQINLTSETEIAKAMANPNLSPEQRASVTRAIKGPTVFDRTLAGNSVGTLAVLLLAVLGFLTDRPEFLDIGLTYALLNLIGTLAVLKFFRHGDLAYDIDHQEEHR